MTLSNKIKSLEYNKYINYLAVFYAFTIPLSRAGIVFAAISMTILWVLEGGFREKIRIITSYTFVNLGLILFIYLFFSILWSENSLQGFKYFERFWYFSTFFVLITSLKKEYIKYILSAFIFSMLISEIFSYGIAFELWTYKRGTPENPSPIMWHIEYSVFLAFTSLLLLNKSFLEKNFKYKLFYIFFFITATGNLFLGLGRAGQLIFLVTLIILFMVNMKNKFKSFVFSFLLAFFISTLAYNVSTTFNKRVNITKEDITNILNGDYTGSWGARASAWIVTGNILLENPIFGTGIGDIRDDYKELMIDENEPKHSNKHFMYLAGFHSDILEVASGGGIVGLILFISIFYYLFKLDIINKEYRNILIIFICIFAMGNFVASFLRVQFTMDLFSLFAALLVVVKQNENRKELYEKNFNNK